MAKKTLVRHAFNRGLVSRLGLSRTDVERISLSAETQTNWMPRVLGSMMSRPGLGYLGTSKSNAAAKYLEFIYATDDTAAIELTDSVMRVWVSDALITRPTVATAITDGTFVDATTTNAAWTDADESGAVSAWDATSGHLGLTGTLTTAAIRRQALTVAVGDQGVRHAIKVVVSRGTCVFKVGSNAAYTLDDYVTKTTLGRGEHSLSFIPTGASVYVQVENSTQATALVSSITMATAGVMEVATPWVASDLPFIGKPAASADVLFIACKGKQQMKIERRATYSWSVVYYEPSDGPFLNENITPVKLAPSALTGSGVNITATNTTSLFKSTDVGRLIKIRSIGQKVTRSFTANGQSTESVRITAVGSSRTFPIVITGLTGTGDTIALQRSIGDENSWVTVASYTTDQNTTSNDALDNQIVYYRLTTTVYAAGTPVGTIDYTLGSSSGIGLVTSVTTSLIAVVDVLDSFGSTTATNTWSAGIWSNTTGWPSAVGFRDGRLWWGGKTWIIGSVSDGYNSFDSGIEGDSAPIIRTIGFGPVDVINWLGETNKLIIGTAGAEIAISSTTLEETVTNSTFNLKLISSQGSALIAPASIDTSLIFARRGGTRLFEIDVENQTNSLTTMVPDLFDSPILKIAVQRLPDTRLHAIRTDGKAAVLVFDKVEKVFCWILIETDGVIEDVIVLPGTGEDSVYYLVKRTINSSTKRYFEKWALESEARGGVTNKMADSFITYSGTSTVTMTGLGHLEAKSVIVWGNSKDLGTYTVTGGSITLSEAVTLAYIGLPYTATYKSAKLAPLTSNNRIDHIGLNLLDTHAQGLEYGQDFTIMDNLPLMEGYGAVTTGSIWDQYDEGEIELPGEWGTDSRLCLRATAPRPCTVTACIIGIISNERG